MIFIVEVIVFIILFSLVIVVPLSKNPISYIYNYPPKIVDRIKSINKDIGDVDRKKTVAKKLIGLVIISLVVGLVFSKINKIDNFKDGFIYSYLLWFIVDWYDFIVLDVMWFCHSKKVKIKGSEDMEDEYKNYKFHFMKSVKGMFIGVIFSLLVGLFIIAI